MTGSKELIPTEQKFIPQVIDESGRKIVGPELEMVAGLVTQMAQLAQLAKIRKSLEREHFEGKADPRMLSVSDKIEYDNLIKDTPWTPWVTAYFYNDGPNTAYISINNTWDWQELRISEDLLFDFLKADKRIELIYYKCDPGETASIRAIGKY